MVVAYIRKKSYFYAIATSKTIINLQNSQRKRKHKNQVTGGLLVYLFTR